MYCKKCGAKIDEDSNYCDACGKVLKENKNGKIKKFLIVDEKTLEEMEKQEEKTINIRKILIIIGVIILLALTIYLAIVKIYSQVVKNKEAEIKIENSKVKEIDTEWTKGNFIFDGSKYELNTKYNNYEYNNWIVDNKLYNYTEMSFIKNDKTSVSIPLTNKKYDSIVKIGIINLEDDKKEMKDCNVWGITINNINATKPVKFKLSKGIKNNSTKEEIIKAFGELDESKITINQENVILHYQKDNSIYLDLTVTNDKGLEAFSYKKY